MRMIMRTAPGEKAFMNLMQPPHVGPRGYLLPAGLAGEMHLLEQRSHP
jgi:hypothetical protein